jgi:hypothetical protein
VEDKDSWMLRAPGGIKSGSEFRSWFATFSKVLEDDDHAPSKKAKKNHVKRPMNAYMLFRTVVSRRTRDQAMSEASRSKGIGKLWGALPGDWKTEWFDLARIAQELHKDQHGDYKYSPRRSREKRATKSRRVNM